MAPGSVTGGFYAADTGENSGLAYFWNGTLDGAYLTKVDKCVLLHYSLAVVEIPDRVKVNPKSIIKLALNAGRWLQKFGNGGYRVEAIEASAWKASTDPDVLARRILACLTPEELARVPKTKSALGYNHNVVDAIGLGLWRLGRMGRGGRKIT